MNPSNRRDLRALFATAVASVATACVLSACATSSGTQVPATLTDAQIAAIVGSADRTAADRDTDQRRKPEQVLGFIGVRPGMVALDIVAGGGYTTELLARSVGPSGKVVAQAQPRDPSRPVPAGARPPGAAVLERAARLSSANVPAAPIALALQRTVDPVPPDLAMGKLDVVTLMFNYHDLGALGEGRTQMNRAIFAALKPGGVYVIADHAGRPGTGISESTTLHRVDEAFVRSEVEAAGFRLLASGAFLRNLADTRDQSSAAPTVPNDQFILKFVKPN